MFHADRGTQYTSAQLAKAATELEVLRSMGRTGMCWDNAAAESFWSMFKNEYYHRHVFATIDATRRGSYTWIDGWYNAQTRHSGIGYSPSASGQRRGGVVEFARTRPTDLVQSDGIRLTSLPDTLIDVARTMPHLTALVMLDAAVHRDRFSTDEPLTTIDELRERFATRLPFPGSRKVAALLDMATKDADSPSDTLRRWRARELGSPEPELQGRVWILSGRGMYVYFDLAWPEFGVWGEADGAASPSVPSPQTAMIDRQLTSSPTRSGARMLCAARLDGTAHGGGGLRRGIHPLSGASCSRPVFPSSVGERAEAAAAGWVPETVAGAGSVSAAAPTHRLLRQLMWRTGRRTGAQAVDCRARPRGLLDQRVAISRWAGCRVPPVAPGRPTRRRAALATPARR